jgi:hypothetical protein
LGGEAVEFWSLLWRITFDSLRPVAKTPGRLVGIRVEVKLVSIVDFY